MVFKSLPTQTIPWFCNGKHTVKNQPFWYQAFSYAFQAMPTQTEVHSGTLQNCVMRPKSRAGDGKEKSWQLWINTQRFHVKIYLFSYWSVYFFQQKLQFLNIRQIIPLNSACARNYSPLSKINTAKLKIQAIFSRKFAQHIHHFWVVFGGEGESLCGRFSPYITFLIQFALESEGHTPASLHQPEPWNWLVWGSVVEFRGRGLLLVVVWGFLFVCFDPDNR